ncbi:unnamed protein product [Ceutorhynchus assimilis]|uniref:Uncharacterized protein n=1 Tax=Ceutorhynchus assimilis TaxID=467358 RepID=A0A9N9QIQ8_9CUCU|nr:unnamed protein product [Ceutorhynchus assimilis]
MAADNNTSEHKVLCKYCKKDVINYVKCCKCDEFFHPSCLVQSAKLKNTQCVHETQQSEPPTSEAGVEVKADVNNPYVVENNLLLRIIKEMEEKYDILMENCNLLKEKVSVLKEKVNGFEEKEKQQGVATSVSGKDAFVDISNATPPNASSSSSIESRDGQQGQRVQQHKSGVLYSQKYEGGLLFLLFNVFPKECSDCDASCIFVSELSEFPD